MNWQVNVVIWIIVLGIFGIIMGARYLMGCQ